MKPVSSTVLIFSLIAGSLFAPSQTLSAQAGSAPNVVLIISDDQAWTDYGFMGHPSIRTPNLDRLARQSLTFPNGYVPSSLCCPSLASMITGRHPFQHKITGNEPPAPPGLQGAAVYRDAEYQNQCERMDDYIEKVPTLPRLLSQKNYLSFQSGKWWHGSYRRGGFTHGMTHGDPARGGRHGDVGLEIGRKGLQPIYDFIEEAKCRPFFIWYAPFLPHTPHTPPDRLLEYYKTQTDSLPIAKYWAMCEWFDETCGELLDYLDQKNLSDNTLVLYVTDNGWINDPTASRYAPRSKRSQYDGGLRTPIMARWPGHIPPGTNPTPVSSIDLAPTILNAAGITPHQPLPGVDLLNPQAVAGRTTLYGDIYHHNAIDIHNPASNLLYRWCLQDGWKLIVPNLTQVPDGEVELYQLYADPYENHNLASSKPDLVARLSAQLNQWWPGQ